jgi:peptidoglycan/xylan/chitin deacetylase (PgdA/CDA1 family)
VFTGDEYAEGAGYIANFFKKHKIHASFFLTGRFYDNPSFKASIAKLRTDGHYLGPHSYAHLLYCGWTNRDSLLVTQQKFNTDLIKNINAMSKHRIRHNANKKFFLPPYEWYNDTIAKWTRNNKMLLINYTPGTLSHADYTTPSMKNYRSSETIYKSIMDLEKNRAAGLNGFILLMHIGAGPERTDKFYLWLPRLVGELRRKGYHFQRIDELLAND